MLLIQLRDFVSIALPLSMSLSTYSHTYAYRHARIQLVLLLAITESLAGAVESMPLLAVSSTARPCSVVGWDMEDSVINLQEGDESDLDARMEARLCL